MAGAAEVRPIHIGAAARDFDRVGAVTLRAHTLRALQEAGEEAVRAARESARATFPHGGGLADLVAASSWSVTVRSPYNPTVQVKATSDMDLDAADRGTIRHPVFGHPPWVTQAITPGWLRSTQPRVHASARTRIEAAMRLVQRELHNI